MQWRKDVEYISVAEIKAKLSEKLRSINARGRTYAITSHGKPKAVLLEYKAYLALVEKKSTDAPAVITLSSWRRGRSERKKITESVASLFDAPQLTRKGQKRYKQDVVTKRKKIQK